jgi:hypothetical protein
MLLFYVDQIHPQIATRVVAAVGDPELTDRLALCFDHEDGLLG